MAVNNQPQTRAILFLIIILGIAGGYLYNSQIAGDTSAVAPIPDSVLDPMKEVKIDFAILEDSRLSALKIFGELPVNPGATGKSDPFSSF